MIALDLVNFWELRGFGVLGFWGFGWRGFGVGRVQICPGEFCKSVY